MIFQHLKPIPALQECVKEYLLLHFKFDGSIPKFQAYTPRPEQCLTFTPRGRLTSINKPTGDVDYRKVSYLSGQHTAAVELHFNNDEYCMLKVVFQPGALYRLLGIPLDEFGRKYVDAESVLSNEIRAVNEQLANAESYSGLIRIVETYLLDKLKCSPVSEQPIDKIGQILEKRPDEFSLQWFASQACLSPRQFERKFLERMGVGPKLYCRIARFHKAFEMKDETPSMDWLSVAIRCGYSDFQHLNKDFKEFASVTPTVLLHETSQSIARLLKLE